MELENTLTDITDKVSKYRRIRNGIGGIIFGLLGIGIGIFAFTQYKIAFGSVATLAGITLIILSIFSLKGHGNISSGPSQDRDMSVPPPGLSFQNSQGQYESFQEN